MVYWSKLLQQNNYFDIKKYLHEGGNIQEKNEGGTLVLMQAIRYQCDDVIIKLLLKSHADLHDVDHEGVSVFDFAVMYHNVYVVDLLIDRGFDVNTTTRASGFTPLMEAVSYGDLEMVKKMLMAGANVTMTDTFGLNASDYARKLQKRSIQELLEL